LRSITGKKRSGAGCHSALLSLFTKRDQLGMQKRKLLRGEEMKKRGELVPKNPSLRKEGGEGALRRK